MKANETQCLPFLKKTAQFQIPIYQRPYSWTEAQCQQLWKDVERSGADASVDSHFIGSVVYIHDGVFSQAEVPRLVVIDGQQRLTTLSLLILALADEVEGRGGALAERLDAEKLRQYHLTNPLEAGEYRHKLLLTYADRETLRRLVDREPVRGPGLEPSLRIVGNLALLRAWMKDASDAELDATWVGLGKLTMIDVSLDREHDDPQLIFESLNSTGLALSQADLIRNYVLMGLELEGQKKLFEDHWQPMERAFGLDAYASHFDKFVRHFLTLQTRSIPRIRQVYREFKHYCQGRDDAGVGEVVATLHRFAGHFARIARVGPQGEPDAALARTFGHLGRLKVDTAMPVLLEVYDDYAAKRIGVEAMREIAGMVESYVFRRVLCDIPTNTHNKTFSTLATRIDKEDEDTYVESFAAALLLMKGSQRFPDDAEVTERLKTKDIYSLQTRDYALEKLENYRRKEPVRVLDYTVEHVLPQNPKLPEAWREALGADWKAEHARLLHTLGNLTLTGYNSELRDHPFVQKRDHEGGFANSPLWLNKSLAKLDRWDSAAIEKRTAALSDRLIKVWPVPTLDEDTLAIYRVDDEEDETEYRLEDLKLLAGNSRQLFDALDARITAMDDRIERRIKKKYVAYRLNANLVSVVPQAVRLKLFFSVPPAVIDDPRGVVEDMTGKGHWGTGKACVGFKDLAQLDDVMTFFKQAYRRHGGQA